MIKKNSVGKNFYFFIFHPTKEIKSEVNIKGKFAGVFKLLILTNAFLLVMTFIKMPLINFGIIPPLINNYIPQENIFKLFLLTVMLGPLIEEIAFRLWIKYNKFGIVISLLGLSYYFLSNFNIILIWMPLLILIYLLLVKYDGQLARFWIKNVRSFIIISSFVFGCMHTMNFVITPSFILFSPIILSPFIFAGLIFGYIRVRYGIIYAYIAHLFQNLIPLIITIVIK